MCNSLSTGLGTTLNTVFLKASIVIIVNQSRVVGQRALGWAVFEWLCDLGLVNVPL
jgi:hypothetical protein